MVAQFGRIDILVNNAGSAGPKQPIENLPLSADELAALKHQRLGSAGSADLLADRFALGADPLARLDGAAFGPEPKLTQSAWFRYHNASEDVGGLYFVGAGTHPFSSYSARISSTHSNIISSKNQAFTWHLYIAPSGYDGSSRRSIVPPLFPGGKRKKNRMRE